MQNEITKPVELLDDNGHIIEEGWARRPYWNYDRSKIKAPWHRIKEWDYYSVLSHDKEYGIAFTLSDLSYAGMIAICWLDFKNRIFTQIDTMSILPMGKTNFPSSSEKGDVSFEDKKIKMKFAIEGNRRILSFQAPGFEHVKGEKGLEGEIILNQPPDLESMVIATSWKEKRHTFYYNEKINCMPAEGTVKLGNREYKFTPDSDFGAIDWGRGHWTWKNRWYWGSASGIVNGEHFGWNIGYGFSDRTPATENMLFYKGKAHKLDKVTFKINPKNYMEPWKFTSNDGRFELDFEPILDRSSGINLLLAKSVQHQVFGYFTGDVILDDGTKLHLDRFLGFAEDVLNWL